MDDAETALNVGFGRESLAAFAGGFVEKSCCSLQSLLPDGFARHITKSELRIDCISLLPGKVTNCRSSEDATFR
jgi:hypothetical protein